MIQTLKRLIACAALAALSGCLRQEVQVAEYSIPALTNQLTAAYIQQHLKNIPGTEDTLCDINSGTMTVTYNTVKARYMNYEEAVAMLGFDINNRPANPQRKAALPKGLK